MARSEGKKIIGFVDLVFRAQPNNNNYYYNYNLKFKKI
jgi:hypothetical protein